MKSTPTGNKIIGILGILFGLGAFAPLVFLDNIIIDTNFFPLRYFKVILCVIVGFYFLALGILTYIGFLAPWFYANEEEKAKHGFVDGIFSIPFLSLFVVVLAALTTKSALGGLWLLILWCGLALLIILSIRRFFAAIKALRNLSSSKKSI